MNDDQLGLAGMEPPRHRDHPQPTYGSGPADTPPEPPRFYSFPGEAPDRAGRGARGGDTPPDLPPPSPGEGRSGSQRRRLVSEDHGPEEPPATTRFNVRDLLPGMNIRETYLLAAKETRTTRAGKPFFKLRLCDRTGNIDCTVWETDRVQAGLDVGDLALVTGRVSEYQGRPQLEASAVEQAPAGAATPHDFLPSTYRDVEELKGFLRFHIDSVYDHDYSELLEAIFGDETLFATFCTAPAAKFFHHAYLGGLLEHTVAVTEMCEFVAQQYARVDRDLLLTAALLHDIGKMQELSFDTVFDYTAAGHFLGHVILGVTLVTERVGSLPSFPEEKLQQLLHCIVSHHGELEWGSPKRPNTLEALILHHVDNLDAKVKGFLEIIDGSRNAAWTDVRNLFRRPLHVPRAAHQEEDFLPPLEDAGPR